MNQREYNKAVDLHSDDLYRFALRYTGDSSTAWDPVQDSFVTLWEHRQEVDADDAKRYLIKVLYRKLVDLHRNSSRTVSPTKEHTDESYQPQERFELSDTLQAALAQLPSIQRTLLLMKDLEGYSYKEMADMTQLSEQQVMVYLYRARVKMRKLITR